MEVEASATYSHIRSVVKGNLNRNRTCDLLTPDDAKRWFEDPLTTLWALSDDEIKCLDRIRDANNFYVTDTESVGKLLVQVAVVDSKRCVVFSDYIHHDCETVEEIWQLAADLNGGKLTNYETRALRRSFGSPSTRAPRGQGLAWLNEQWKLLKAKHDRRMVRVFV